MKKLLYSDLENFSRAGFVIKIDGTYYGNNALEFCYSNKGEAEFFLRNIDIHSIEVITLKTLQSDESSRQH
jgi:hypothetical protein